ncbi:MAG: ModE family transcriptional regulator [Thermoprotei archaeon]|nr:MAG: ModE family transcriptional regulator [Thermoprotei archaeon]
MEKESSIKIGIKIWLEKDGQPVLGEGGARLLELINKYKSLSHAAREMGVSYTFAWNYIKKREKILGIKLIETERGGKRGGETFLTNEGIKLLRLYKNIKKRLLETIKDIGEINL